MGGNFRVKATMLLIRKYHERLRVGCKPTPAIMSVVTRLFSLRKDRMWHRVVAELVACLSSSGHERSVLHYIDLWWVFFYDPTENRPCQKRRRKPQHRKVLMIGPPTKCVRLCVNIRSWTLNASSALTEYSVVRPNTLIRNCVTDANLMSWQLRGEPHHVFSGVLFFSAKCSSRRAITMYILFMSDCCITVIRAYTVLR